MQFGKGEVLCEYNLLSLPPESIEIQYFQVYWNFGQNRAEDARSFKILSDLRSKFGK